MPIIHVSDEAIQEVNSHDKSVPTITLCDSSTQTDILETISVGTKPKTPPGLINFGTQAVVINSDKDIQACIPTPPLKENPVTSGSAEADAKEQGTVDDILDACNDLYEQIDASLDISAKAIERLSPQKEEVEFAAE